MSHHKFQYKINILSKNLLEPSNLIYFLLFYLDNFKVNFSYVHYINKFKKYFYS